MKKEFNLSDYVYYEKILAKRVKEFISRLKRMFTTGYEHMIIDKLAGSKLSDDSLESHRLKDTPEASSSREKHEHSGVNGPGVSQSAVRNPPGTCICGHEEMKHGKVWVMGKDYPRGECLEKNCKCKKFQEEIWRKPSKFDINKTTTAN